MKTCPTVYLGQIVFFPKAVCPTWYTYLYQEPEKNQPPLENSLRSPMVKVKDDKMRKNWAKIGWLLPLYTVVQSVHIIKSNSFICMYILL